MTATTSLMAILPSAVGEAEKLQGLTACYRAAPSIAEAGDTSSITPRAFSVLG